MTRISGISRIAAVGLAAGLCLGAFGATAEAGPAHGSARSAALSSGLAADGLLVQAHDRWRDDDDDGWRHHRHHRHHHRRHWNDGGYYYSRPPVVVERYRYVEPYYYYNPFDSLFGALVFNFSFDGHHRGDGHRDRGHHHGR